MSFDRNGVRHATFLVVSIAILGATALSAAQPAQQPPPSVDVVSPDQRPRVDPVTGTSTTDAQPPAPTPGATLPAPVRPSGKVGPGGKAISQRKASSPDGGARIKNPAVERLGPGGAAGMASAPVGSGPDGAAARTLPSGFLRSEIVTPSPARGPGSRSGAAAAQPAAQGGVFVFIDPATGLIVEPTEAQVRAAQAQNPNANQQFGDVEERPNLVGGGMMADVPRSRFPAVTASVGSGGKVTLQDGRAQAGSGAVVAQGPGGNVDAELPPPTPDVTITIVNLDGAGEGFNDNTAVAPVFGNPGVTRGQQRLNAFRAAAEYWGGILRSTVPIRIDARMDTQFCDASSATLGSAGPNTLHRDFAGAPFAATWYVQAVANSITGGDVSASSDIDATFNSAVDNPTCLGATSWWYGIGAPAPGGTIDFYTVVLHEIGHGIGVLTLVDETTGAEFNGFDDAYEKYLWDWTPNAGWPGMTNAQRAASAINTGNVIFWGPRATEAARGLLSAGTNQAYPRVYAPNPVEPGSSTSHFDTALAPNELMEPFITPPPGPWAFVTSGLLQDVGWRLLGNGIYDFGGANGTWTWNPTDGWFQPSAVDPADLEPFNGNFVGSYPGSGTWLWNETTSGWSQLTTSTPNVMKACRDNLLWAGPAFGTWRWNATSGWLQLSGASPQSMDCLGSDLAWESPVGTWLYNFATGAWSQLSGADPAGILACGSRLVWWRAGDTWYWDAATGWHNLGIGPESTECYRGLMAWEGGAGTWLYNFTSGAWTQITTANPEQILAWGPSLVWENAASGTWVWDGGGWTQITSANATRMAVLGADLLWAYPSGTWAWSGGGAGTGWTSITSAVPTEIVSSGAVK
jgi:hypothetical protein